ncbi:hypothetical protein HPULCUR_011154 [Helicostylum pulchrum]|uniref:Embryonic stem cell-specific 5-hydroxymethylcytosine-binding protein n=1 Tax=Helicostylum pulchrum TaxID=562976 RepID=A0ABP9YFC2_9FUNG
MCGRFCCSLNPESLETKLYEDNIVAESEIRWVDKEKYFPSYNVCPARYILTMYQDDKSKKQVLQPMQWGFIPSWSKTRDMPINARAETLQEKSKIFDSAKRHKRCVIITEGFYEWKKLSGNKRKPYFVKRKDGQCMVFAGLYDTNTFVADKLNTCVIITTHSTGSFASIHSRMPVILDHDAISTWLDCRLDWSQPIIDLLKPFKGPLDCYQVGNDVGAIKNDSPSLIVPIDNKESSIFHYLKKEDMFNTDNKPTTETKKRKSTSSSSSPSQEVANNKKRGGVPKITNFFMKKE